MIVQEAVANKLQGDRGLANSSVTQHHDLVDAEAARCARSLRHAPACLLAQGPTRAAPAAVTRNTRSSFQPSAQTTPQHNHYADCTDKIVYLFIYHTS